MQARWLFFSAAVIACGITYAAPALTTRAKITVNVEMTIDSGRAIRGIINDGPVQILSLVPGEKHNYAFASDELEFNSIRIYPADTAGANVTIHAITIAQEDILIAAFDPAAVSSGTPSLMSPIYTAASGIQFNTSHSDANILYKKHVPLKRSAPQAWINFVKLLADPATVAAVIVLAVVAIAALGLTQPGLALQLPVVAFTLIAAWTALPWISSIWNEPPPVHSAVGRSAYLGLSPAGNAAALNLSVAVGVLAAAAAALLQRTKTPGAIAALTPAAEHQDWIRVYLIPWLMVLIFFAQRLPDLAFLSQFRAYQQYTPDFDASNTRAWMFLKSIGEVPLRDYWFPYWNLYFNIGWPSEDIFYWACISLLTFGLFFSIYLLTNRNFLIALLTVYAIYAGTAARSVGHESILFTDIYRLGWAPVVVLFYTAIDDRRAGFTARHFWFGLYCSLILYIEISQILYAVPGVGLVFAIRVVRNDGWNLHRIGKRLLKEFSLPAITAGVLMLQVFVQGRWPGFRDLYLKLGDVAQYSAVPADLSLIRSDPLTMGSVVVLLPSVFIAAGLYLRMRSWHNSWTPRIDAILAVGLCAFMLAQKHIVRPMESYCLLASALAAIVFGLHAAAYQNRASRAALGAIVGIIAALMLIGGQWRNPLRDLRTAPKRAYASLATLMEPGKVASVQDQIWHRDRFAQFVRELAVVRHLEERGSPKVYVLGDQSAFYILLRQPAPYQINFYNASPISEQQRVVDWLKNERPDYVIWDPSIAGFEQVPHTVRVPLIFEEVIASFVPESTISGYQLLRRRRPDEPIAFAFWRDSLSSIIDLGHIPRQSELDTAPTCESNSENCVDVLRIDFQSPPEHFQRNRIAFVAAGETYFIHFVSVPEQRSYAIRLDRIWPWQAALSSGESPNLVGTGGPVPFRLELARAKITRPTLY